MDIKIDDIISRLKESPEDLYKVCEAFDLRFPYERREDMMKIYEVFKNARDMAQAKIDAGNDTESVRTVLKQMKEEVSVMQHVYQIFNPEFDEQREKMWLPSEYGRDARKVFEYRKGLFSRPFVGHDLELSDIVNEDLARVYEQSVGKVNNGDIYVMSFDSIQNVTEKFDEFVDTEARNVVSFIRSYAVDSFGGIAMVSKVTKSLYADTGERTTTLSHVMPIVADNGYFMGFDRIYEPYYGSDGEKFEELVEAVLREHHKARIEHNQNNPENEYEFEDGEHVQLIEDEI